jgi:tetratricopeptide (TPR) repeat protein
VADGLEDEDAFERKLRGRGRWKWVLLFSLLGVGLVTAALYAFDRPWFLRILGMEDEAPVASEQVPDLDPALEARRRDDLNGAEAVLQDALQRAPGQPRLLTALSDVYATWADYLGEVGETDQARQRSEASLARAEEALATTPESVEVRVARANALRVAGRNAEAQALATELATAKVGGALLCYVQGALAATEANRLDAAERSLQESLAQDSSFWRAHVKLARLARERRDYAAAKKHLEAILAALPAHPFAKRLLDGLPATTPPLPDAAAPPASAPPIPALAPPPAPKAPPAGAPKKLSLKQLLKMGHRLRESNPRKALKLFEEVQSEGPSAAAHHGKGWAYLELGELTLASREFQRALDLGFHGDSYIGLGTAYRRLGQREKARRAFERYLEKYPNGEEAPVAKTSLESLK